MATIAIKVGAGGATVNNITFGRFPVKLKKDSAQNQVVASGAGEEVVIKINDDITIDGVTYAPADVDALEAKLRDEVFFLAEGGSAAWGGISGTLANQTDLQGALDAKAALTGPFNGLYTSNGSNTASNLAVVNAAGGSSISTAQILFGGAAQIKARVVERGGSAATLAANDSYGGHVIGAQAVTGAATGTHAWMSGLVIKPPTFTSGGATLTNSATLYVEDAPSGATNNWAIYVAAGNIRTQGKIWGGADTSQTHEIDYCGNSGGAGIWGRVRNLNTSGYAALSVGSSVNANHVNIYAFGSAYASAGAYRASNVLFEITSGSLYFKAATDIRFHTGPVIFNGGDTGAPDATAQVQIDSTTKGFLPPRMTTTQRDAITSPIKGLVIFNSTTNKLNVRGNTAWEAVTSA